jgi:hypothetical protein
MVLPDVVHVAAENGGLEAFRPGEVVGDQQEAPGAELAVPDHHVPEVTAVQRLLVTVEHGVQHGHEMALTRTERAVQVGGLRAVLFQGGIDQVQRLAEGDTELGVAT